MDDIDVFSHWGDTVLIDDVAKLAQTSKPKVAFFTVQFKPCVENSGVHFFLFTQVIFSGGTYPQHIVEIHDTRVAWKSSKIIIHSSLERGGNSRSQKRGYPARRSKHENKFSYLTASIVSSRRGRGNQSGAVTLFGSW